MDNTSYDMTNNALLAAVKDFHAHKDSSNRACSEKITECENFINAKGDPLAIEHAIKRRALRRTPSGHLYIQLLN